MPKVKSEGRAKAKRDPKTTKTQEEVEDEETKPKRGLSAYMFFANDTRDKVREDNPGIKFGEVGKMLGEMWKGMNEKQKAPYEAKAAADKKRYEEEKAAWTARRSAKTASA